jgi:hypothetical protein
VYGRNASRLQNGCFEEQELAPIGDYAKQKMSAENFLRVWASSSSVVPQSIKIVRPFSVYGPWGRPDMLPLKLLHRAYTGRETDLAQLPDGSELMRDYTYVDDVVQGLIRCTDIDHMIKPGLNSLITPQVDPKVRTYNLGYGEAQSLLTLVTILANVLDRPIAIRRSIAPPVDVPCLLANTDTVFSGLGWRAKTNLQMGLQRTIDWYVRDIPAKRVAIVVIATKNRPDVLPRALLSVHSQTHAPLAVVVVDDNQNASPKEDETVEMIVRKTLPGLQAHVITNKRTPGASGAWNSGILESIRIAYVHSFDWHQTFIAILDDDDEWLPHHLQSCLYQAQVSGAGQVVPGIVRITNSSNSGRRQQDIPSPQELTRHAFYTGNPHV